MATRTPPQPWKTGLCDCTSQECADVDYGCSYKFTEVFGSTYSKVTGRDAKQLAEEYFWSHKCSLDLEVPREMRQRLRDKYNLEGDGCGTWCAYGYCSVCAVLQDAREVALRETEAASSGSPVQAPVQASMTNDDEEMARSSK